MISFIAGVFKSIEIGARKHLRHRGAVISKMNKGPRMGFDIAKIKDFVCLETQCKCGVSRTKVRNLVRTGVLSQRDRTSAPDGIRTHVKSSASSQDIQATLPGHDDHMRR